jgi:hypothetical protein
MSTGKTTSRKDAPAPVSVFTEKEHRQILQTLKGIYNSRFKDPANPPSHRELYKSYGRRKLQDFYKPEAFDFSNPQTIYRQHWQLYLDYAALHNMPKNRTGSRRYDTTVERRRAAKQLRTALERIPTADDLKSAFPSLTTVDKALSAAIDRDLKTLLEST